MVDSQISPATYDSPPPSEETNGSKRKADDGGAPQQRAKRNRYISIACNECKRRKIKCNGQTPCQRCGNLNLECVYAPNCCNGFKESQEYRDMSAHVSSLQDQINALWMELNVLRAHVNTGAQMQQPAQQPTAIDPTLQSSPFPSHRPYSGPQASPGAPVAPMSPSLPRPKSSSHNHPSTFRGPTSNEFNFGVAKSSLQTMGITGQNDEPGDRGGGVESVTREGSPSETPTSRQVLQTVHADKDPLWQIAQDEAVRLIRVYDDEMGVMYPMLDIEKIIAYTRKLYRFMEAAHRSGLMQQGFPGADAIDDEDTNILKLVIATALTVEAAGQSDLGKKIFDRVSPAIENLLLGNRGLNGMRMLSMAAMYEFHSDRESNSWRLIGLAARSCIEMGLHRRETYDKMEDSKERYEAILLFWSVYVLDRRWSFGTGMPFALQDVDIDSLLPKPEGRSPYLQAMIEFSSLGAKVWNNVVSTSAVEGPPINDDEMAYLDYQVCEWHTKVPSHLYFHPQEIRPPTPGKEPKSRADHRLPYLLYLRRNHMRLMIFRPACHSATAIMTHREQAQRVVDIAKDSIRVLTHIRESSDLYQTQQMLFNAFLTSALATLFLAVAHTPAIFASQVRTEYYMGLEIIRAFNKDSYIGKRLWRTVRVLIDVAPKLGLLYNKDSNQIEWGKAPPQANEGELDPNRSAAVAMAGLAGHKVDETALLQGWPGETATTTSPEALANDLSSLFEAAGSTQPMDGGSLMGNPGHGGMFGGASNGNDGLENPVVEDGLSNILKELF